MCGIASITLDKTASPTIAARLNAAATALLAALDHRGGDACGILSIRADGRITIQKAPLDARDFNAGRNPIPAGTRALAIHTRFATSGSPGWNRNNHPVSAAGALVMHNGVIWENLRRTHGEPEVDTYALALAAASVPAKPSESAQERANRIAQALAAEDGSAAVHVAYRGEPFLISARLYDSPMHTASAAGARITASTREAVTRAADALGLEIPTETYTYSVIVKKAKKGRPAKTRTATGTRQAIHEAKEGTVLAWHAGTHTASAITLPEPYRYTKPWSSSGLGSQTLALKSGETQDDPDTWSDDTYETVARRLLAVGETFTRCDLCDEMTEDTERWHSVNACTDCRRWYETADVDPTADISHLDERTT